MPLVESLGHLGNVQTPYLVAFDPWVSGSLSPTACGLPTTCQGLGVREPAAGLAEAAQPEGALIYELSIFNRGYSTFINRTCCISFL